MKNLRNTLLLFFVLPLTLTSCFEDSNDEVSADLTQAIVGQYLITGFQYEGIQEIDSLDEEEFGNSYISLIKDNDTQVTVRLVFETEEIDFSWNLKNQNVVQLNTSEYSHRVTPGETSLNNLHLSISETGELKATFSPILQPNITVIHARM